MVLLYLGQYERPRRDERWGFRRERGTRAHQGELHNQEALASYRRAEKLLGHDEYVVTVGIARTSYVLGDKNTSVDYYKRSITQLQAENKDHNRDNDIAMLQETIKQIEAK
jgi:hypothetical protein